MGKVKDRPVPLVRRVEIETDGAWEGPSSREVGVSLEDNFWSTPAVQKQEL